MTRILTHNAKFHADDVFAVATLLIMLGKENCQVIRSRDPAEVATADYVVDIGGEYDPQRRLFDHHQVGGAADRPNGIPYASFGLVWKEYGEKVCGSDEVAVAIDTRLVQPIDAGDNGKETYKTLINDIGPYTINAVVDSYRATWKEEENWDERFMSCVEWAMGLLTREIKIAKDWSEGKAIIQGIYEGTTDKRIIVIGPEYKKNFGRELVTSTLSPLDEPLYAVFHRSDADEWQVVAMRKSRDSFELKKPLPAPWAGKRDAELADMTGVADAFFCHKGRFMCMTHSQAGALELAKIALNS